MNENMNHGGNRWPALLGGMAFAPVSYLLYAAAITQVQGHPIRLQPPVMLAVTVLFLGFLGGVTVEGWYRGFRWLPIVALVSALVWPWVYPSTYIGQSLYVIPMVGGVVLVGALEGVGRFSTRVRNIATPVEWTRALGIGVVYLISGFVLQFYVRRFRWVLAPTDLPSLLLGIVVYFLLGGLGLVVLGALPVILWQRARIATPAVLASGWLLWGFYGIWRTRERFPLSVFAGIDYFALRPYPDFILQFSWTIVLLGIGMVATTEWIVRNSLFRPGIFTR